MIAVSYLKSKINKTNTIKKINESNADYIHVDLMDGLYAGENNFTINEVIEDLKNTTKPIDIHLMVNNPEKYIEKLSDLKPDIITFHLDSANNPYEVIDLIKKYNIKVGIAINPDENINILNDYIDKIDYILIMSVYPGSGGQTFIKEVLNKIDLINKLNVMVGIDGGINENTINYLKNYNIDIIVSGSFICMNDDYNKYINILKDNLK